MEVIVHRIHPLVRDLSIYPASHGRAGGTEALFDSTGVDCPYCHLYACRQKLLLELGRGRT